jgi:hypothetical protein
MKILLKILQLIPIIGIGFGIGLLYSKYEESSIWRVINFMNFTYILLCFYCSICIVLLLIFLTK